MLAVFIFVSFGFGLFFKGRVPRRSTPVAERSADSPVASSEPTPEVGKT
jgi:hypothetical protein